MKNIYIIFTVILVSVLFLKCESSKQESSSLVSEDTVDVDVVLEQKIDSSLLIRKYKIEEKYSSTDIVYVTDVNELFLAIKSNTTIILGQGDFRLDHVDSNLVNPNCRWTTVLFDEIIENDDYPSDWTLLIDGVKNLNIIAEKSESQATRVLTNRKTASVMAFNNCENIDIRRIYFGHDSISYKNDGDPWVSYCSGEVLEFFDTKNVLIDSCDLFGCGTRGFLAHRCKSLNVIGTTIHDCSYGAFGLFDSEGVVVDFSVIKDNTYRTLIEIESCSNVDITNTRIANNQAADQWTEEPLTIRESNAINISGIELFGNDFDDSYFIDNE